MSHGRTQPTSEVVDAMLLAARGSAAEREFQLVDMPRLSELAAGPESRAFLRARFHMVETRAAIAGRATTKLRLICQRCLRPVEVQVDDEFHVVLVGTEAEMDQLTDAQDVVIADASRLDLEWFAEEQLLLAMPLVPMHAAEEECSMSNPSTGLSTDDGREVAAVNDTADNEEPSDEKTQRPFANLRDLLKKS